MDHAPHRGKTIEPLLLSTLLCCIWIERMQTASLLLFVRRFLAESQ